MPNLIVTLQDKRVVFPDGIPICLACGGEVAGTRRVTFEPVDDFVMPTHAGKLISHFRALRERTAFDAPLCEAHLRRAAALAWKAPLHLFGGAILLGAAVMTVLGLKLDEKSKASWLLALPGFVWFAIGYFTWIAKDRGGLPCEATRLEDGSVLLKYPDPDPAAP